jgi:hypothetical protein
MLINFNKHNMLKVDVKDLELVGKDSIKIENLKVAFEAILADAEKANKGNTAAGRRFRLNTTAISKSFLEMRKVTPKAKANKKS